MKYSLFLFFCLFSLQSSFAQNWKKDAKPLVIKQDDYETALIELMVPGNCTFGTGYTLYEQGKSNLTITNELDDEPNLTVKKTVKDKEVDLLKYSTEIADKVLAGSSDITISNKTVASKIKTINGFQTLIVTYDYSHVISGANLTEKGKVTMYMINVSGTSLIYTETHPIIIRLKFDYHQNDGDPLDKLGTAIINTMVKGS